MKFIKKKMKFLQNWEKLMPEKNTFLSDIEKTPKGEEKRHLRIVITNPDENNEQVVVSITTDYGYSTQDRSCPIEAGEHSFIKHKSLVDFKRTCIMSFSQIFNGIQKGLLIPKEDVSEDLLKRIQNAAKFSTRINQDVKNIINKMIN